MIAGLKGLKDKPWVAHLLRANERFTVRLGNQFGAAITYFSILAVVPVLMLSFSLIGFVLTEVRPGQLGGIVASISEAIGGTDQATRERVTALIRTALTNYAGIGLVGLASALYSGAGWMGNLRKAIRGQWRPDFDFAPPAGNIIVNTAKDLLVMLGLVVGLPVTFALASVATSLTTTVMDLLGLAELPGVRILLTVAPVIVSVGVGWLLFVYLYTVLPENRGPWPAVRRGALAGAIGLAALQYLTSLLVGLFAKNPAAALFGPVIAVMLFFNLFARLILFIAAWIATTEQPALPSVEQQERVRFPLHPASTPVDQAAVERAAVERGMVPQQVAVRSVRLGIGAGYLTGTATGAGLGAFLAYLAGRLGRRRQRR